MSPVVETLNFYLAVGGIGAFLFAIILIIDLKREQTLRPHIEKYGLHGAFLIALGSSVMALVYSETFGFVPCGLCWFERIFLFPQALLLLGALYMRDKGIAVYGILLSVIGLIISLYHHYIQMGGSEFVKCPAAGNVDCAKRILFEFDFVTFPLLGAAGFALLITLYYYIHKAR